MLCAICDTAEEFNTPLNAVEVEALYLALTDEYYAWAVYAQVLMDFGPVRPFSNIQQAEAHHISAVINLLERYSLPVPENPWIGQVAGYEN